MTVPASRRKTAAGWERGASVWTKAYRDRAWGLRLCVIFPSFMRGLLFWTPRLWEGWKPAWRFPPSSDGKAALTTSWLMWTTEAGSRFEYAPVRRQDRPFAEYAGKTA